MNKLRKKDCRFILNTYFLLWMNSAIPVNGGNGGLKMNESHDGSAWCKRHGKRVVDIDCSLNCFECENLEMLSEEDVLVKEKK